MDEDNIPIISQVKSFVQVVSGDEKGARKTLQRSRRGFSSIRKKLRLLRKPSRSNQQPGPKPVQAVHDQLDKQPGPKPIQPVHDQPIPLRLDPSGCFDRVKRSADFEMFNTELGELPDNATKALPKSIHELASVNWNDMDQGINAIFSAFLLIQMFKFGHPQSKPYFKEICTSLYPNITLQVCEKNVLFAIQSHGKDIESNASILDQTFSFLLTSSNSLIENNLVGHNLISSACSSFFQSRRSRDFLERCMSMFENEVKKLQEIVIKMDFPKTRKKRPACHGDDIKINTAISLEDKNIIAIITPDNEATYTDMRYNNGPLQNYKSCCNLCKQTPNCMYWMWSNSINSKFTYKQWCWLLNEGAEHSETMDDENFMVGNKNAQCQVVNECYTRVGRKCSFPFTHSHYLFSGCTFWNYRNLAEDPHSVSQSNRDLANSWCKDENGNEIRQCRKECPIDDEPAIDHDSMGTEETEEGAAVAAGGGAVAAAGGAAGGGAAAAAAGSAGNPFCPNNQQAYDKAHNFPVSQTSSKCTGTPAGNGKYWHWHNCKKYGGGRCCSVCADGTQVTWNTNIYISNMCGYCWT